MEPTKADAPIRAVYIARHGHTALNGDDTSPDRIRGHRNIPLDKTGRQEARKAASDMAGRGVYRIISSDLDRAADTAKAIGQKLGLPVETSRAFRPWNLGKFQGQESAKVHPQLMEYIKNKPTTPVPGGESFREFVDRAIPAFNACIKQVLANKKGAPPGKAILIVTHFRDLKLIQAWLAAGAKSDNSLDKSVFGKNDINPGSIYCIDLSKGTIPTELTEIEASK